MSAALAATRLLFIGGGHMARSLIGGLLAQGLPASQLAVVEPKPEARDALLRDFGVAGHAEASAALAHADIVVLAVKPQTLPALGATLAEALAGRLPLLISVAAGVRLAQLSRWFGAQLPIIRCMPNTPALLGAGASALCANAHADGAHKTWAQALLDAVGVSCWLDDEAQLDTVTALSGSGPAYVFLLAEAMQAAAAAQGLPAATARLLAAQTCLGAGRMLAEGDEDAATLRQRVTSPQGTTAAAVEHLLAGGWPDQLAQAMAAARRRAQALADALD